jgi:hypothetical protein
MMQKQFKSIYVQMFYSLFSGLFLLTIPNSVITLVGFKPTQEKWIYVVGLLALSLCFYYFQIAKSGSRIAVLGTVYGRWFFTSVATIAALVGIMPKLIIPMMLFEAGLAFWAWIEIKK